MKITDEMEAALKAIPDGIIPGEAQFQALRTYLFEHFAPVIARAENEACAWTVDRCKQKEIAAVLRLRYATPTPSTPQEK